MKSIKHIMVLAIILGVTATPGFAQTGERKLNIDERYRGGRLEPASDEL